MPCEALAHLQVRTVRYPLEPQPVSRSFESPAREFASFNSGINGDRTHTISKLVHNPLVVNGEREGGLATRKCERVSDAEISDAELI